MTTLQRMLDSSGFKNDLSYSYDPMTLTPEQQREEQRVNQRINNAERKGNLNGAPSKNHVIRPAIDRRQYSNMIVANGMLGKAKQSHSKGTVNGFKNAQDKLKMAGMLYESAGEHHKAKMARSTLAQMDPMPAMDLLQQIEEEGDPKKQRIMYGKLASVYSKYGMSEKASNSLKKSVAGGRRRTKRSKKSNRRTRRQ